MNKAALKAELDKRGIAHDPEATNKELEALLKPALEAEAEAVRLQEEAGVKAAAEADATVNEGTGMQSLPTDKPPVEPVKSVAPKLDIVGLRDDGRIGYIRTYSLEAHGRDYQKLAKMYTDNPDNAWRHPHIEDHNPDAVAAFGGER